jgi:ABC-type nitrate/sulfonate/bicarbonate transport system permease component
MTRRFPSGLLLPLLIILSWELASSYSPWSAKLMPILSAPSSIALDVWKLSLSGDLVVHIASSLIRVLGGFAAAVLLAVPIGVLIGVYSLAEDLLDPVLEFLRPIPPPAWIPLGILWFGIGNTQNMFIICLGAFFPIALNTIAGVRASDPLLTAAALTLGASNRQIVTQIVLPASFPSIVTGIRVGLGMGWMALVAAELVAGRSGLGFLIQSSRYSFLTERIFVGMIVIGLLGLMMDMGMKAIQRRMIRWH